MLPVTTMRQHISICSAVGTSAVTEEESTVNQVSCIIKRTMFFNWKHLISVGWKERGWCEVMQNSRNLFSGYRDNPLSQSWPPPWKCCKHFFFPKDMWVHDFCFCFAVNLHYYTVFLEKYNKWREVEECIQVMTLDHCHHVNEIK